MISITKEEKEKIINRFPDIYIVRTMKQKSKRHHYFCEETRAVLRFLDGIRGERTLCNNSGRHYRRRSYQSHYQDASKAVIAR